MKKVQCIIRPQKLEAVERALFSIGVQGMTVREVRGCGRQSIANLMVKSEIEVIVCNYLVEDVITTVMMAGRTGEQGDGKIFVSDVDVAVRIRTGERAEKAI